MVSITILLPKLDSSSLIFAMLGAYNNTVKNPDPEKIVKPISAMLPQHCRPCCYYANTVTFLIRCSTNICQKQRGMRSHLLQKPRENLESKRKEVAAGRVGKAPRLRSDGGSVTTFPQKHWKQQQLQINVYAA